MTPSLRDLEDKIMKYVEQAQQSGDSLDRIKAYEFALKIIPTEPQFLAAVYFSSPNLLDQVKEDGGMASSVIKNNIQAHLVTWVEKLVNDETGNVIHPTEWR
tara:strand:+ start:1246 stop:1551 length:306 start_codon:yes stop_codon:yes gene_type:complete